MVVLSLFLLLHFNRKTGKVNRRICKMTRYYSTQRPVMPGTFPKPTGNRIERIVNFPTRTYIDAPIWRRAWGYIDYEKPLGENEASAYELVYAGGNY